MNPCQFGGCAKFARKWRKFCPAHLNQMYRIGEMFPLGSRASGNTRKGVRLPRWEGDECPFTLAEIKAQLLYDPEDGSFTVAKSGRKYRRIEDRYGRVQVGTARNAKLYLAHRIAWLFQTGQWPDGQIDHINGDKSDNRFSNLRLAGKKGNLRNRRGWSSTGVKGVTRTSNSKKYRAQIWTGSKNLMKRFNTVAEAQDWYAAMSQQLHGEFQNTAHRADRST